ncbi:MAG: hypothetical protein HC809_07260 [Gammaproteobacteria bacterium]|nr:hypothetical protein [Gammaproteobacteria bacterium]
MTRWSGLLAALFAFGRSDGEAHFLAESLLADLYGALLLARLRDNATGFGERLAGIAQRYRGHLDQRQSAW